jgi:hypothetical protein
MLTVLIPPPVPVITLSPALSELPDTELESVERCVASLAGKIAGVLVTDVHVRGRHRIVKLETTIGSMVISERTDAPGDVQAFV